MGERTVHVAGHLRIADHFGGSLRDDFAMYSPILWLRGSFGSDIYSLNNETRVLGSLSTKIPTGE